MRKLNDRLAAIVPMTAIELRAEWRRVWKEPAPPLSHDLLRRGIAWKLQERVHGGIPGSVSRELDRLARQLENGGLRVANTAKPGTRLVRQWHGKTYHVLVLDDGYVFEDRRYTSLTQIAETITGVRWSGPRFFGLRKRGKGEGDGAH